MLIYTYFQHFNQPRLKLKLLYSLFAGRHVIVNPPMVEGSGLNELCHICNMPTEFQNTIKELINTTFDESMLDKRKAFFKQNFSNTENTNKLLTLLFPNK